MKKLRSKRGESLVESLVSILVFTLASVLFLTMVSSAARINVQVEKADQRFEEQQAKIETEVRSAQSMILTIEETVVPFTADVPEWEVQDEES